MLYRHKKGVRLALLSGHATRVGPEWKPLHDRYHQAALAAGCEVDQTIIPAIEAVPVPASPEAVTLTDDASVIRRTLEKMLERSEEGDFTANTGLPNIKVLEKLAGIQVNKGEVYAIFRAMKAEVSED